MPVAVSLIDIVSGAPAVAYVEKLELRSRAAVVAGCVMLIAYGVADGFADVPAETKLTSLSDAVPDVTNTFFTAAEIVLQRSFEGGLVQREDSVRVGHQSGLRRGGVAARSGR